MPLSSTPTPGSPSSPPASALSAREEAQVLLFKQLTEGQLAAAPTVCQLLRSLDGEPAKAPLQGGDARPAYARFELSRKNHLILIDGGRGSGKTALLITLLAKWRQLLLRDEAAQKPILGTTTRMIKSFGGAS